MAEYRIRQWAPFRYRFEDLDGKMTTITFTCPTCGGHNCEKIDDIDKDCFWSGHYRCSDCGETRENGHAINYYSDAFTREADKPQPVQLSLW